MHVTASHLCLVSRPEAAHVANTIKISAFDGNAVPSIHVPVMQPRLVLNRRPLGHG